MEEYVVIVERTVTQTGFVRVQAESPEDAMRRAPSEYVHHWQDSHVESGPEAVDIEEQ